MFELLHPGQILTVQVMKDMLGTKGARLSTDLSIPSRYLVLMPYGNHIGVSQRIESEEERDRLRNIIESIQAEHNLPGSVIVRTAAEGVDEAEIAQDMCYLSKLWEYIQRKQVDVAVPSLILKNYRCRNELSVIWQVKKPRRFMSIRERFMENCVSL